MAFYRTTIEERNGEQEYTYEYLIEAKSLKEAERIAERQAREWYGGPTRKGDDGYYFDGGALWAGNRGVYKTTKEEFVNSLLSRSSINVKNPEISKPRIVIVVDGGLIQQIEADRPVEIRVFDYDVEGANDERIKNITDLDGHKAEAFVSDQSIMAGELRPYFINHFYKQVK